MAILSAPPQDYKWKAVSVEKLEYKPQSTGVQKSQFVLGLLVVAFLTFLFGTLQSKRGGDLLHILQSQTDQMVQMKSKIAFLETQSKIHQKAYQELSDALLKTNLLMERLSKNWDAEQLAKINAIDKRLSYLEAHQKAKEEIEKELLHYKQYEILRKPPIQ